ncbi:MAG: thioredoxin family protein [Gemmataceae bacterium]|nr:thioredoxin family protein [Planctomycetia bacterium]MBX3397761.1 thioredoxin family protein [Gemmataceae bacterium]
MSAALPRAFALFVLVVAFGPPPAVAADPKIEWRTDYFTARKESQETGLPILVQIGSEDCFYCKKMEATTLKDRGVAAMIGNFIPLKLDGAKEANLVQKLNVQLYPTTVLAGADGTIHAFVQGYVEVEAFKEQLKRTTDLVAADVKAGRELAEAATAIKAGEYGRAVPILQRLAMVAKGKPAETKAKAMLADLENVGGERLRKAVAALDAADREPAIRQLDEITRVFAGTEPAKLAEARLVTLGVDRLDRVALAMRATALLTAARDLAKAGAYAEALHLAELLDGTAEAKAAAALVADIKADAHKLAASARRASEAAAALQLTLADAYTAKGQADDAAKCLELAIRLAPNSPKAIQAEGRLTKLRGAVPAIPAVLMK